MQASLRSYQTPDRRHGYQSPSETNLLYHARLRGHRPLRYYQVKPLQKLAIFLSSESLPTTSTTTCALCIHYDIHSVPSSSLPRRSYHTFIDPILLHEGIINLTRLPILDHIDNPFPVKPIETRALHVSMTHSEYNVPFLDSLRLHLLLIFIYLHQRHPDHGCYSAMMQKYKSPHLQYSIILHLLTTRATIWGGY